MSIDPSQPIRVMLVDDHTMVRRGLAAFNDFLVIFGKHLTEKDR